MNIIKKILPIALFVFIISCDEDDRLKPEDITSETGIYGRIIESPQLTFDGINLMNPDNVYSVFLQIVESTPNDVASSVEFFVSFNDNTEDDNGQTMDFGPVSLGVFPSSSWSTFDGLPSVSFSSSITESTNALGMDLDNVNGGDVFVYSWQITDVDGSTYNSDNFYQDVGIGAFNSPFRQNVSVICPVSSDYAVGNYAMSPVSGGGFEPWMTGPVTLQIVEGNSTQRTFDFTYLPTVFPVTASFTFELSCGNVLTVTGDAAVTCGGGRIGWVQGDTVENYDPSDDNEIFISFLDSSPDGGCGVPPTPTTIKLTKQ